MKQCNLILEGYNTMNFSKKLYMIFFIITLISLLLLFYTWYKDYKFDNSPVSDEIKKRVTVKKQRILKIIHNKYKINFNIPLRISEKMDSRLFGATVYDSKTKKIEVYLNKKRFKENIDYMIDDVMPHEYAHALMFRLGEFSNENSGHTLRWQKVCLELEGKRCDRFVNHNDILIDKTKMFY